MERLFDSKVAFVTGAASGIGRATACTLAREGAAVFCSDIDEAGGKETVGIIEDMGGRGAFGACDVSSASDVEAAVTATLQNFGRLDCAVNNAGVEGPLELLPDITEQDWDRTMAINLKGAWLGMKYQIPAMLEVGAGAIVNTSSLAGIRAQPNIPVYSASKFGLVGLTRAAALQYAQSGIRVNAVCPGGVNTPLAMKIMANQGALRFPLPMPPIPRFADPQEVAEVIVWLCSDRASFITGVALPVDGGCDA